MDEGLSYDDVLLVPRRSSIRSRRDVSTETQLTRKLCLKAPIVSANMDTVTESAMAIAMAQLGGIGIIHRFNTIEQQAMEVAKVKRFRNAFIQMPLTINSSATLAEAKRLAEENNITGLLVTDSQGRLEGILTSRDMRLRPDDSKVIALMTPRERLVVGRPGITIDEAKSLMVNGRIEKLPIVTDDWSLAGLFTLKDIHAKANNPEAALDSRNRLLVGAAIGVKSDALDRARALVKAGADVLVIDIAHGHSDIAIDTLKLVKQSLDVEVIAGNVATPDGVKDLAEAGADAIKVGVGPGTTCITRIVTGAGFPQLSAVLNCSRMADKYGIPIIADGGIKYSGDITKAIAAGASTVMLGGLLAGTDESPGVPFIRNGRKMKVVRGMASFGAKLGRDLKENTQDSIIDFVPEGVEATVDYKGMVSELVQQLLGGLRSGMSYCGSRCIGDLRGKGEFVRITAAGMRESQAHDVNIL